MMHASRAWTRRVAALSLVAAALLAGAGCARRTGAPPQPPVPPPPVHAIPGYEALVDSLALVDASGLAGRRIAIDPGHGGFFPGARGVHGLTEAEVNLGVALGLRDLLAAHGAVVFMTRDRDRDFLSRPDSSLKADLTERMRLANAFGPDVFLSIHHNADASGAHDVNETQTYYKFGDSGPSLDLAQDIHRALVRNIGIRPHKVVPGNYSVLRNSEAPAVLTETSYLTNPDVEDRLRLPEKQQLEAQALFVGLARYFARPVPVIVTFAAADPRAPGEDSLFARGEPTLGARIAGSFDQAELEVDGVRQVPVRIDDRVEWRPAPLLWPPGAHEAMLRVRLAGVGTSRERRLSFVKECRPAMVHATLWPAPARPGGWFAVRIEVRDLEGRLCPDSTTRVRVRESAPRLKPGAQSRLPLVAPSETLVTARDGIGWAYLRLARTAAAGARASDPRLRISLVPGPGSAGERAPARAETLRVAVEREARSTWTGFVNGEDSRPLRDALGTREPERAVVWQTRDGFAVLSRDSLGGPEVPRLPGYRRLAGDGLAAPAFVPLLTGVLHGRRITIDPEGGGEDPAGVGPSGTRAAYLNLETARILSGYLVAAGALVHLTRDGDFAVTEVERVQGSEEFRADRYLRIGHRLRRFGYYFSSPAGKKWAASTAATFAALDLTAPFYGEEAQYPLQQTSCPALYASPARVDSSIDEEALLRPGALRAEAYGLFIALAKEWAPEGRSWPVDSLEVHDADGAPVPGAIVTLGGAIELQTDPLGRARFARTEPGPIEALVRDRRVRARALLLDSTRGAVLTGARGN